MGYIHIFGDIAKFVENIVIFGGYPLLFLLIMAEGLPLLGAIIPGHIAIVFAGFLVSLGVLNIWTVVIMSIIAAILGDALGYYLGRKYGLTLINRLRPFFGLNQEYIDKICRLIMSHTGKSMILGRLSPITRALTPFLVGANRTHERTFWIFNIIGACIWVILSISAGYIFGQSYTVASEYTGRFALILITIIVIMIWGYYFINKQFHIFKKYELFMLGITIISSGVLIYTIRDAFISMSRILEFDILANILIFKYSSSEFINIAWAISEIGGVWGISILGISLFIYLLLKNKWRSISILTLGLSSTIFWLGVMKEFFMRARPVAQLVEPVLLDPSFPSGHAAIAATIFIVFAYLIMQRIHSWILREIVFCICIVSVIIIGLSRLIINVHWVSDVVAGWALGALCASMSVLVVRYVSGILQKKIY